MTAIEERRQRAREAAREVAPGEAVSAASAAEAAIEAATRVRVTQELLRVFDEAWYSAPQDGPPGTRRAAGLAAAFRAAGFEVETMSAAEERRQRAREAFADASPAIDADAIDQVHAAAEGAIETASRVRVTQEVVRAAIVARDDNGWDNMVKAVEAAFRAAGFEVEA